MAMTIKNLNQKKLIQVKNINGCTNFGSLELVGDKKMYTIKTSSDNRTSTISQYPDYMKTTRKNHKYVDCMNHGNDITYYNGKLYIAPCGKYIQEVDIKTWKHRRLECSIFISALAHWSGKQFVGVTSSADPQYTLALLELQDNKMVVKKKWKVNNPRHSEGFYVSQGMGVKKSNSRIFVIFTRNDFLANVIIRSKLYDPNPDYLLFSKVSTNGKYELEGLSFRNDGKKVIGSNLPDGKDATFLAP